MGRSRRKSGLDTLAALPWPIGVATGIAGFVAVRYGIVWWLSHQGGLLAQGFAQQSGSMFAPLAWLVLVICWMAAFFSYLGKRHRRQLLETRTTLESLSAGGWRQFELLVGEAFRCQGYIVEETGLGGADGGIDLILRKDGRRTLVQCKQWKRQQVGVSVVREMAGLLAHHQADAVKIVCIGRYTHDAERFAQGKPIELIGGEQLLTMIRVVQRGPVPASLPAQQPDAAITQSPYPAAIVLACPRCGNTMVERRNRRTGETFLGCSQFPRCRGSV
ncbi:restriction endonuclease [Stenotrophomonas sp. MMGLT7]|uniref:restriction endonuclease n=1 Tax=Stenotrophomonas sp. MMGLT7 TaxID=2901227 RepID=UPI001E42604D|nr:restriction endonuclease [Stenotrophomonas sp. MMGLT7]MCD7098437.1 restriction endonuclease [Stenotrophomonas sp. MMGLT7]